MKHVHYDLALKLREKGFPRELDIAGNIIGYNLKRKEKTITSYHVHTQFPSNDEFLYAPFYCSVIDWLFKKLDFNYPYLKIEIFSDGSGRWYHPKDDDNEALNIDFDNINQAIEEALKLI